MKLHFPINSLSLWPGPGPNAGGPGPSAGGPGPSAGGPRLGDDLANHEDSQAVLYDMCVIIAI